MYKCGPGPYCGRFVTGVTLCCGGQVGRRFSLRVYGCVGTAVTG